MPYIDNSRRTYYDKQVKQLANALLTGPVQPIDGPLNYAITTLIRLTLGNEPTTYGKIERVVGLLTCIKDEYTRRIAAPYEDIKREVNGDVY